MARAADPRPLAGQAALVTGGAKRIGAAVCRRLASAGCDVVVHHHRSGAEAKRLVHELEAAGVAAASVAGDLGDPVERAAILPAAAKALGRKLTLLVNNASTFPERQLSELRWSDLQQDVAVNAWAPFELTMAFARHLPKSQSGHIINFLDARIVDDDRRHVGYFLAKRMLADLTRLCAIELAPRIAVNAVAPGPTLAPPGMLASEGEPLLERLRTGLPLQRNDTPEDLADAVVYLASSKAVTGQILYVDGGRHLGRGVVTRADTPGKAGAARPDVSKKRGKPGKA